MAVEFNIGTLSPEESTILGNFKYIQNTLFPDGNIPPLDEIQDLLKDGNPSIKDAYIGKFYASGVPTDPFLLQHPDTKEFASKFSEAFSQKVRDTPTTILGAAPQMQAVSRQFDLNTSYKDFVLAVPKSTKTIKGIASPLKTAVSNVIEGKEVKAEEPTLRFPSWAPQVIPLFPYLKCTTQDNATVKSVERERSPIWIELPAGIVKGATAG